MYVVTLLTYVKGRNSTAKGLGIYDVVHDDICLFAGTRSDVTKSISVK